MFCIGCDKESEYSDFVEGNIVGSFQCPDNGEYSYFIMLENGEDGIYTYTLPENTIDFPEGLIKTGYNAYTGGPNLFPDSLRQDYKIRFKYRLAEETEVVDCPVFYFTLLAAFPWEEWDCVIISDVTQILD